MDVAQYLLIKQMIEKMILILQRKVQDQTRKINKIIRYYGVLSHSDQHNLAYTREYLRVHDH